MKQFYVIGNPISHSLSPKIFNYFFNNFKINAQYNAKLIKDKEELFDFIMNTKKFVSGYNITSPYKKIAYDIVDKVDKSAERNCSVNCIKVQNQKLIGYNTDEYGFSKMLDFNMIALNKKNILVFGYGKAADIVVDYILTNTKSCIFIHGRNKDKIKLFINRFKNNNIKVFDDKFIKIDMIINCLSTKISNNHFLSLLNGLSTSTIDTFINLNYIKINLGKTLINKYISGLDMLIFQAHNSFNIWFNNEYKNKINFLDIKKAIKCKK